MPIRSYHPGDEEAVTCLLHELARTGGGVSPLTSPYTRQFAATPGCGLLIAEEDGAVVGVLSYTLRPNLYHAGLTGSIDELVVTSSRRGRGIGRALLLAALQKMKTAGCIEVSITAMPENINAIRLYKSIGLNSEAVYLETHFQPINRQLD